MALILIALNYITGMFKVRLDLTQEKAYTLSKGTRAILKELDSPVTVRFYCTQPDSATRETLVLRRHAREVEDLLQEFRQAAGGKLKIEKYDPTPDSDAEDSARLDGIQGQLLSNGEPFYLGLTVSRLDQKEEIPFLSPARERELEYDIARAIARVANPTRPVIGLMSALPIWGTPSNPMMSRMGQHGSEPWTLVTELQRDFTVKRVEMDAEEIPSNISVMVVIHPEGITDKTQFALDQFVLRGGKLIAFLDPFSVVGSQGQTPMNGGGTGSHSTLDKLLKAWGLSFDTGKVVADVNFSMRLQGRNGQPVNQPAWLSITPEGMNRNDVTMAEMDNIWLPMAGAFTGTPADGLTETPLLKSTKDSQLVEGFLANLSGEAVLKDFKPSDKEQVLALRLQGKFKTAFPEGKPSDKSAKDETNAPPAQTDFLKESKDVNAVILVGDSDLLYDDFTLRKMNSPFGRLAIPMNANLTFAQNCVEQMAGDQNLIEVRSRATLNRPFEVVKQMEAEANQRFQGEVDRLQKKAQETQQRLNQLQAQKTDGNQRFILSPEQEQELAKLRKEEAETQKNLRQVQKDLKKEIVRMENTIKWANVLTMPVLVSLFGIGLAVVKNRRTGAR